MGAVIACDAVSVVVEKVSSKWVSISWLLSVKLLVVDAGHSSGWLCGRGARVLAEDLTSSSGLLCLGKGSYAATNVTPDVFGVAAIIVIRLDNTVVITIVC